MYALLIRENQQGTNTYDNLLKMVEDSCAKIEQIKMR